MKTDIRECSDIGILVRQERKKQYMTQVQLAAMANVGTRFVGELERGKPTIELGKALRVLRLLGIRIEMYTEE